MFGSSLLNLSIEAPCRQQWGASGSLQTKQIWILLVKGKTNPATSKSIHPGAPLTKRYSVIAIVIPVMHQMHDCRWRGRDAGFHSLLIFYFSRLVQNWTLQSALFLRVKSLFDIEPVQHLLKQFTQRHVTVCYTLYQFNERQRQVERVQTVLKELYDPIVLLCGATSGWRQECETQNLLLWIYRHLPDTCQTSLKGSLRMRQGHEVLIKVL